MTCLSAWVQVSKSVDISPSQGCCSQESPSEQIQAKQRGCARQATKPSLQDMSYDLLPKSCSLLPNLLWTFICSVKLPG